MVLSDVIWAGLAGLLAAILMTLFECPFWKKRGMEGVAEWQVNWVMISRLNKKWKETQEPILSWTIVSHISHGIAAGIAFRVLIPLFYPIFPFLGSSIVLDAFLYGIILWLIFIVLPRNVYASAGRIKITKVGILGALFSDSLYGLFLGLFIAIASSAALTTS